MRTPQTNRRLVIVSVILVFAALFMRLYPFHAIVPLRKTFGEFPLDFDGWTGRTQLFTDDIIENLGVTEYMQRTYRKEDHVVGLYVGYYAVQKEGSQIHSPKHCLPGGGWLKIEEEKGAAVVEGIGRVSFVKALYQKGAEKELFVYWYKMRDRYITNEYVLKLNMITNSMFHRRSDAAFIRISTYVTESSDKAMQRIEDFMEDFLPRLGGFISE